MCAWIPLSVDACEHHRRRCYGAAVESALLGRPAREVRVGEPHAPRLLELLSQLDADGHDTEKLRTELWGLLETVALRQRSYRVGRGRLAATHP